MDDLDAGIFRELHRDRTFLWGGIDPRIGATELADRLDVDRTTVWSRLKAWEADGFLLGQEVVPNSKLFGAGIGGGAFRVDDPRNKDEVFASLELVDGVLTWLDQVGPWVLLGCARESAKSLERCTRLIGELPGVAEVAECLPFLPPESEIEPTARDWRIIAALREDPKRPLAEVAEEVGVSRRTLTRRYGQLLEAQAVWSFPTFDFSRYRGATLARFAVVLPPGADTAGLINRCRDELDGALWLDSLDMAAPGHDYPYTWVDAFCHLSSAGETEPVQVWLMDQPDVEEVMTFFPRRWHMVADWFDERIEAQLRKAEPAQG